MTKKELKDEINRLLDIIKRQSDQIDKLIVLLESPYNPQTLRIPGPHDDMCVDGGPHDWPNPWHAITLPYCKKCGKQSPNYNITYTSRGTTSTQVVNPSGDFSYTVSNVDTYNA